MSDIVKHLRAGEPCGVNFDVCRMMNAESGCLCAIAADTIEARRAEVDRLTFVLSDARMEIATLKATQAELVKALEDGLSRVETNLGRPTETYLAMFKWREAARAALARAKQTQQSN